MVADDLEFYKSKLKEFKKEIAKIESKETKSRKDIYLLEMLRSDVKRIKERIKSNA